MGTLFSLTLQAFVADLVEGMCALGVCGGAKMYL